MKILLIGGSGCLGQKIIEVNNSNSERIYIDAPAHQELDILNMKISYPSFIKKDYDLIIHAAAMIGLENCETNKAKAYNVNVIGTGVVCKIADQLGIPLVYISTDYVFDGSQGSYAEDSVPNPMGYYAKTKWAGENICLAYSKQVIRTSFCKKMWPHHKAFNDKWSSFDDVDIIARLILMCCIKHDKWVGILHVGTERKTFYEMARRTVPDVIKTSIKNFKVFIPPDTSFDCTKMNGVLKS